MGITTFSEPLVVDETFSGPEVTSKEDDSSFSSQNSTMLEKISREGWRILQKLNSTMLEKFSREG